MADGFVDEQSFARDMIEVHGMEAATVARDNARSAALARQLAQAKSWIRVLGIIQQVLAGKASAVRATGSRPPAVIPVSLPR